MKTCVHCGKIVGDSAPMCPDCKSMAFHTDSGTDGLLWDAIWKICMKNPVAGIAVLLAVAGAFALFIIVLANM